MLRGHWSGAVRVAAAFAVGAAARAAVLKDDEQPSALYAGAVQAYEATTPNVVVDYPMGYDNLDDLARDADAIVVAHLKRLDQAVATGSYETVFAFDVERSITGEPPAGGDVAVGYPGGTLADGRPAHVSGDPPFEPGMSYLLFLREGGGERYHVLAGPAGRLVVLGGRLYALSVVYQDGQIFDTGISGVSLDRVAGGLGGTKFEAVIPTFDPRDAPLRRSEEIG